MELNKKKVNKELWILLIPLILENIFQSSAGVITTAMVGRLTAAEIVVQGISLRITSTLWVVYKGLATGLTVLIAYHYGKGDDEGCQNFFSQSFISIIPISIIFLTLVKLFPDFFIRIFTKDPEIMEIGRVFINIVAWSFPFAATRAIVTGIFQGYGNTRTPLFLAICLNFANLVVAYILIFGYLGFPRMNILGAAYGQLISEILGAIIGIYMLFFSRKRVFSKDEFNQSFLKPKIRYIKQIFSMGIPVVFEQAFWQVSSIVMSKSVLTYGTNHSAAYNIGLQAETITEMPAYGFSIAATSMAAKAIGKEDDELYQTYFKQLRKIAFITSIITSIVLLFIPRQLVSLLTDNETLQNIAIPYLFLMGFAQIPQNLSRIYGGTIRAAGYKNVPTYVAAIGIWAIRIPITLAIVYVFKADIKFIWLTILIDQVIRFLVSFIFFNKKNVIDVVKTKEVSY